jgi:hypothetical protein
MCRFASMSFALRRLPMARPMMPFTGEPSAFWGRNCRLGQESGVTKQTAPGGIRERQYAEGRKLYKLIGKAVQPYLQAHVGGRAGLLMAEWFDPSTLQVFGSLRGAIGGSASDVSHP